MQPEAIAEAIIPRVTYGGYRNNRKLLQGVKHLTFCLPQAGENYF